MNKKAKKKRSTRYTLDREDDPSGARSSEEGTVEGSFGAGMLNNRRLKIM